MRVNGLMPNQRWVRPVLGNNNAVPATIFGRPNGAEPNLDINGIPTTDLLLKQVRQGWALGDCALLAAIATSAKVDPTIITNRFTSTRHSKDGNYQVNLFTNGAWNEYDVNDYFPTRKTCFGGMISCLCCDKECCCTETETGAQIIDQALWLPLMEKAFCQYLDPQSEQRPHYPILESFDGRVALEALTTCLTEEYKNPPNTASERDVSNFWTVMTESFKQGNILLCGGQIRVNGKGCCIPRMCCWKGKEMQEICCKTIGDCLHAYGIIDLREEGGQRLITILNPHNKNMLEEQTQTITLEYFLEWFDTINICYRFNKGQQFIDALPLDRIHRVNVPKDCHVDWLTVDSTDDASGHASVIVVNETTGEVVQCSQLQDLPLSLKEQDIPDVYTKIGFTAEKETNLLIIPLLSDPLNAAQNFPTCRIAARFIGDQTVEATEVRYPSDTLDLEALRMRTGRIYTWQKVYCNIRRIHLSKTCHEFMKDASAGEIRSMISPIVKNASFTELLMMSTPFKNDFLNNVKRNADYNLYTYKSGLTTFYTVHNTKSEPIKVTLTIKTRKVNRWESINGERLPKPKETAVEKKEAENPDKFYLCKLNVQNGSFCCQHDNVQKLTPLKEYLHTYEAVINPHETKMIAAYSGSMTGFCRDSKASQISGSEFYQGASTPSQILDEDRMSVASLESNLFSATQCKCNTEKIQVDDEGQDWIKISKKWYPLQGCVATPDFWNE